VLLHLDGVHVHCLHACVVWLQDYDRIMGTNLEASYALCQAMQPLLAAGAAGKQQPAAGQAGSSDSSSSRPKGDAVIVFISSVAGGPLAGRSGSLYAISKAGLNQLAASLACEWAAAGIRVNSVAPWVTLTELGKQVGSCCWWYRCSALAYAVDAPQYVACSKHPPCSVQHHACRTAQKLLLAPCKQSRYHGMR
jgi:NAD(P)-dependent dehydrogenase (short-subunit alcohol dehydrogenase family)